MSRTNKGHWRRPRLRRRLQHRQLRFEVVEDRRMLAITVDTLADTVDAGDGVTSLREAISAAVASETIDFSVAGTIELNSQLPTITRALTIQGGNQITIDAGGGTDGLIGNGDGFRIFNINDGTGAQIDVDLIGLILTGGDVNDTGGAIRNSENLFLTDSTLIGNFAESGGGLQNSGTATINNSTFSANIANTVGGGIENFGDVLIFDSTLSGNSAVLVGGGIRNSGAGPIAITSSTITGNSAGTSGGGIHDVFGRVTLDNTIVAGNTSPSGPDIANTTGTIDGTFNLIGDGTGLTGISDGTSGNQIGTSGSPINALLGPLNNNGGPTETHALLVGSPALDVGDLGIVFNANQFDQRGSGFVRVANGGNSLRIDIGAYESQGTPVSVDGDYNHNGITDAADYTVWRDTLGSTTDLRANGDNTGASMGLIDQADYTFWKSNFGNTTGALTTVAVASVSQATGALAEVPETIAASSPPSLFLSPVAAGRTTAQPVAETSSSDSADDDLLLLALSDWTADPPQEETDWKAQEESSAEYSILPTLDLAFSNWE